MLTIVEELDTNTLSEIFSIRFKYELRASSNIEKLSLLKNLENVT